MRATGTGVQHRCNRFYCLVLHCWATLAITAAFAGGFVSRSWGQELPSTVLSAEDSGGKDKNVVIFGVSARAEGVERKLPQERNISQILPFIDYVPAPEDVTDLETDKAPSASFYPRPGGPRSDVPVNDAMEPLPGPAEVSLDGRPYSKRSFDATLFMWEASNLFSNPLYFEDPTLERYGHTYHKVVQPLASASRFGTQLIGLPYQMTIDPIRKKMYALGWYRPGEFAPRKHYQIPLSARAAAVQGGVVTGLIFLIP